MKKITLTIISIGLVLMLAVSANAQEKKLLLKTPLCFATSLPVLGDSIPALAEDIKAASGGNIQIKYYEPGKLLPPFEILGAVSSGKVNAGFGAGVYWQGKIPEAALFSTVPFGPEADEYLAWIFNGNGLKLYQEMYDNAGYNVKVLPYAIISPETSGWFSKPINGPEDFKGLKMRFLGLGGKVMQKLGVAVNVMPAGEIFQALEKGVIDAAEFSFPAIDQKLGFYKVVKYNYFPGWHQQATLLEMLINKDTWNKMSKSQQALIEMATKANIVRTIAHCEAIQGAAIKENVNTHGVKTMYWSDDMLSLFKKTWDEVVLEQGEQRPEFKKIWDDMSAFRADYAYWKEIGFLPRKIKQ
ncbi:MAG: TRAP transporter substrate-binding protein [Desulfobacula sp.]|uniref:TRAP transporter substrate-binding protein n=1 Tax=Desulfobacula sp. TaxID=2593537 RepID=UPI0025C25789|nr:TRAP transporter substrate-binding protein [Desulfobacula sp.]MCD4718500.1 TRAP transporter substrate-binding protein [Desulfobacula sp.]